MPQDRAPAGSGAAPKTLEAVLSAERPIELYVEAFGAFRFTSFSKLSAPGGEPLEGRTLLERDAKGDYHLSRVPLTKEPSVELFHIERRAYLRYGPETDFRPIPHQPEFDRWASRAVREVLLLYERAGFRAEDAAAPKGNLSCRTRPQGTLCLDDARGLPVSGQIRTRLEDGGVLETRFTVTSADTRPVVIVAPEAGAARTTEKP